MSDDFGSSGVIEGAGEVGDKTTEWVNEMIPSDGKAVMIYGVSALSLAGFWMILYFSLSSSSWLMKDGLKWGFWAH